jgi:hypothetical protein
MRLSIVWRCSVCNKLLHLLYTDALPGASGPTCWHAGTPYACGSVRGAIAMEPMFIEPVHESSTHSWAPSHCLGECLFKGNWVQCALRRDHIAQCEAELPDGSRLAWN